jgi:hypothetical protein
VDFIIRMGPWTARKPAPAGHLAGAAQQLPYAPSVRWQVMFDVGRAAQNMVLAAWEGGGLRAGGDLRELRQGHSGCPAI